jgi:NAD(P)-dependent dehydrogenase (short-subunit alcohol dehydrogenase family)
MSEELAGRAGIVTGGAQGIGRAITEAFVAAGARVAILDLTGAPEAAAEIAGENLGLPADVTDENGIEAAFAEVAETFGRLDFLINNAGVRSIHPILEHPLDVWRRTLEVDLTGTFICTQAAARLMIPRGGGRIVNIASIAGILPLKNRAPYNASKAGVIALTKSTAAELASQGIVCNAIAPGIIETPLSAEYFRDEAMREILTSNAPVNRWGQPEDIANAALYLCGPASGFIHGHTLVVDGGWVATKGY